MKWIWVCGFVLIMQALALVRGTGISEKWMGGSEWEKQPSGGLQAEKHSTTMSLPPPNSLPPRIGAVGLMGSQNKIKIKTPPRPSH